MSGHPSTWPPDRREAFLAALRSSSSRRTAAERLGVTMKSLDAGALSYGVKISDYLDRNAGREPEPSTPPPVPAEPELAPVEWSGARPASVGLGLERRLILGDLHIPFHNVRACAAAIALAKAIQPHVIIQMGDLFNMGAVSHHPRPFGGRENHRGAVVQGMAFLDALGRASPGARKIALMGNHDSWADEFEDEHPEFAGLFAWKEMGLDRLGWEVVGRARQPLVLGPVAYLHGYGGGEHSAKKYAMEVAPSAGVKHVKAAHHHNVQRYHGRNGAEGWIVGWLGEQSHSAFAYAKNRDHWELAVVVEDILGDHVTTTPVKIINGAALFGGRLISRQEAA